jgi:hypothetical protein
MAKTAIFVVLRHWFCLFTGKIQYQTELYVKSGKVCYPKIICETTLTLKDVTGTTSYDCMRPLANNGATTQLEI